MMESAADRIDDGKAGIWCGCKNLANFGLMFWLRGNTDVEKGISIVIGIGEARPAFCIDGEGIFLFCFWGNRCFGDRVNNESGNLAIG